MPLLTSVGVKWVYKTKFNEKGETENHKSILVGKGVAKHPRVDSEESLTRVARLNIVRTILVITKKNHRVVSQMDVKLIFFNWILKQRWK